MRRGGDGGGDGKRKKSTIREDVTSRKGEIT